MNMRILIFLIGLFSVVVGLHTYDSEIPTAPIPVITGGLVMLLALTGLIPAFKSCRSCGRKIPKKAAVCRFCKTPQS
jgi:recombinational DNA repair protein (RecF pathway)